MILIGGPCGFYVAHQNSQNIAVIVIQVVMAYLNFIVLFCVWLFVCLFVFEFLRQYML